jgi:hypothetical protein
MFNKKKNNKYFQNNSNYILNESFKKEKFNKKIEDDEPSIIDAI